MIAHCDDCLHLKTVEETDHGSGEYICESCRDNRAEAAYERYCEDFHDGGSTQFRSLLEQQIEARKLK